MLRKRATETEFLYGLGLPTHTTGGETPPLQFRFAFCTFFLYEPNRKTKNLCSSAFIGVHKSYRLTAQEKE